MQDFAHKKFLKVRDCIHLELLKTRGSQIEVKKQTPREMRTPLQEEAIGKRIKLCDLIWSGGKITLRSLNNF